MTKEKTSFELCKEWVRSATIQYVINESKDNICYIQLDIAPDMEAIFYFDKNGVCIRSEGRNNE